MNRGGPGAGPPSALVASMPVMGLDDLVGAGWGVTGRPLEEGALDRAMREAVAASGARETVVVCHTDAEYEAAVRHGYRAVRALTLDDL